MCGPTTGCIRLQQRDGFPFYFPPRAASIFHQEPLQCFAGGYRNIADLIESTRDPQALLQQLQVFLSLHEKGTKTGQVRVHQLSVE